MYKLTSPALLLNFLAMIFAFTVLLGCSDSSSVKDQSNVPKKHNFYVTNPYEWVGEYHNQIVDYIINHELLPQLPLSWPDNNFIDTISLYCDNYSDSNFIGSDVYEVYQDSLAFAWISKSNPDSCIINLSLLLLNDTILSNLDKQYSLCVWNLINYFRENEPDEIVITNMIDSLESVILSQNWSQDDFLALTSISLMKYSNIYWNSQEIILKSNKEKILDTRLKNIALITSDYCVGAGTALSAAGATGGVGAAAAVWAGVKAGGLASKTVSVVGEIFGWWKK